MKISSTLTLILDEKFNIINVNHFDLKEYKKQQHIIGKNIFLFFRKNKISIWKSFFSLTIKTKSPQKIFLDNFKILCTPILKNKKIKYLILHFQEELNNNHKSIISLDRKLKRCKTEKLKFESIVKSAEDAIITKSLSGIIESWNAGAEFIYGYKKQEIIGKNIWKIFPRYLLDEYKSTLEEIKKGHSLHYLTERQHKNGHIIPVSITIAPLKNANGNITGACSIGRDMTTIRNIQFLQEKNKKLKELAVLKDQFIANASHELRTPLHCILGFTQLIIQENSGKINPKQKEYLNDILTNAKYLNNLINDMLDLSRIESGKMKLNIKKIDIKNLIKEVELIFNNTLLANKLTFKVKINPKLLYIQSDRDKIKQILINYISNAIKFTPKYGRISVSVNLHENNTFRIAVKDSGIGINKENINNLFVRFQQLDNSSTKEYQGSGLGLALVKKIANLLGGNAGVKSKINKGSEFFVIFPLTQ